MISFVSGVLQSIAFLGISSGLFTFHMYLRFLNDAPASAKFLPYYRQHYGDGDEVFAFVIIACIGVPSMVLMGLMEPTLHRIASDLVG